MTDVALNEGCDEGDANANTPNGVCRTSCQLPRCGDGVTDDLRGEVCDDGNLEPGDGCRPDCRSDETCPNGQLDLVTGEQCDDGNRSGRDGCSGCLLEDVVSLMPTVLPSIRLQAIAYDAGRERVVMFGGFRTASIDETWEFDGVSWMKMQPRTIPRARNAASMAYDPRRQRIVMFGGVTSGGAPSDETWEWDGNDWREIDVPVRPYARANAAMTWDGFTGEILMFGGNGSTRLTHTYDGTRWMLRTPTTTPIASAAPSAAYDPVNRELLLVSGDKTYWWDGADWFDRGAAFGAATFGAELTFDANVGRVVAWPASGQGNQLRAWDTQWVPLGTPAPSGRNMAGVVYDAARKRTLLVGGDVGADETWLFAGDSAFGGTWSLLPAPVQPIDRRAPAAGYDPVRGRTVVYSGRYQASDTWEFDGTRWTETGIAPPTTQVEPGVLAYHPQLRTLTLFGGRDSVSVPTGDLLGFDGSQWTTLAAPIATPVLNAGFAYDSTRDRLVAFGGSTTHGCCAEATTWVWDGVTWTSSTSGPQARRVGALAHDPLRGRTLLYGGAAPSGFFGDTWEWDGATWHEIVPTGATPGVRRGHAMVFHPDRGRIVVFGSASDGVEDLWEWIGTRWVRHVMPVGEFRYRPGLAYHAAIRALVAIGGDPTSSMRLMQYRPYHAAESCTSAQIDYDGDGLAGCADPECWGRCAPLCPPNQPCDSTAPRCGDGQCGPVEDCKLCPGDCGVCTGGACGDYHCDPNETAVTCPTDC